MKRHKAAPVMKVHGHPDSWSVHHARTLWDNLFVHKSSCLLLSANCHFDEQMFLAFGVNVRIRIEKEGYHRKLGKGCEG
jgi:hypothetical protein